MEGWTRAQIQSVAGADGPAVGELDALDARAAKTACSSAIRSRQALPPSSPVTSAASSARATGRISGT